MEQVYLQTPLGTAEISADSGGITAIRVLDTPKKTSSDIPESLRAAVSQLDAYFKGERRYFDLRLNPQGTDFQKRVWDLLMDIPYGKTISYLDLAKKAGDPKAIRAVAAANGKNPVWIVIPCHRVIGSDGSLTGYAGGIHRKKWLINHEAPVKQVQLFSEQPTTRSVNP